MERIPVKGVAVRKIDGEILYDGEARSLKEFIQDLVKRGMSLAGTDLRGLNLTHLDLEGGDFAGAWLDGADLRGAVARKASFSGASMRGVRADGIQADRSDFSGADLSAPAASSVLCPKGFCHDPDPLEDPAPSAPRRAISPTCCAIRAGCGT